MKKIAYCFFVILSIPISMQKNCPQSSGFALSPQVFASILRPNDLSTHFDMFNTSKTGMRFFSFQVGFYALFSHLIFHFSARYLLTL